MRKTVSHLAFFSVSVFFLLAFNFSSFGFLPGQVFTSSAWALTADEVVDKVDATMREAKDSVAVSKMILVEKDGSERVRQIKAYFKNNPKGDDLTLTRFLSPADVKGVSFLSLSKNEMYLYMPAFGKIRRIASHVKHESFMGTDFSYDDIGKTKYKDDYNPKILEETPTEYVLEANPKPQAEVGYSKVKLWVSKESWIPTKFEFYHPKKGSLLKVLTNSQVEKIQGHWTPRKMVMENVEDKHKTVIEVTEIKYDTGLASDIFSQRNLKQAE